MLGAKYTSTSVDYETSVVESNTFVPVMAAETTPAAARLAGLKVEF